MSRPYVYVISWMDLKDFTEKISLKDLWSCMKLLGLGLIITGVVAVVEITGCHH